MKPIISLLLSAVLCLCLLGCAAEKVPPPEGDVIFDENGVTIIALEPESVYLEKIDEVKWDLSFYVENNSKDNVDIIMGQCYVNDVNMVTGFSVFDLPRGESCTRTLSIYAHELEKFDFESLGLFTGDLGVYYDQKDLESVYDRPFEVAYGEYEPVELTTVSLLNQPGMLEFAVYNIYTDENGDFVFNPMIENLSDSDITVVISGLTLNGKAIPESSYFGELGAGPGRRDYSIDLVDKKDLDFREISQVESIGFKLYIYESFSDLGTPDWETDYAEFDIAAMKAQLGVE